MAIYGYYPPKPITSIIKPLFWLFYQLFPIPPITASCIMLYLHLWWLKAPIPWIRWCMLVLVFWSHINTKIEGSFIGLEWKIRVKWMIWATPLPPFYETSIQHVVWRRKPLSNQQKQLLNMWPRHLFHGLKAPWAPGRGELLCEQHVKLSNDVSPATGVWSIARALARPGVSVTVSRDIPQMRH